MLTFLLPKIKDNDIKKKKKVVFHLPWETGQSLGQTPLAQAPLWDTDVETMR